MQENQSRLTYLYERWLSKSASEAERREFLSLLRTIDLEEGLEPLMKEAWLKAEEEEGLFSIEQKHQLTDFILAGKTTEAPVTQPAHRIHFMRRGWFRYAAAIAILAGTTIAILLYVDRNAHHSGTAIMEKQSSPKILPGSKRAILTLADGSQIVLDSAVNGKLAEQGNAQVVKLSNGQIAYNLKGNAHAEMMNTMSTPNGGQYQLTLPDGSRVWLNAVSSITFPAAFVGKHRTIKITGEAYLEVSKDKEKPFIVDIDGQSSIEVLGTSFNIKAYHDDESIKSTLVTGSIKVYAGKNSAVLKPGQAFMNGQVTPTDIARDIAWKNGIFDFTGKSFQAVMKEFERWYDIQVQYKGAIPAFKLKGEMDRGVQLENMMRFLQQYGLDIQLEGRKLIIAEKI